MTTERFLLMLPGVSEPSASRQKTANFAAGVALLIAGIVLIVASVTVPSGLL